MPRPAKNVAKKEAALPRATGNGSGNASVPQPEIPPSGNVAGRILRPRKAKRTPWEQAPAPSKKRGRQSAEADQNATSVKRRKPNPKAALPNAEAGDLEPAAASEHEAQTAGLEERLARAEEGQAMSEAMMARTEKKIRQLEARIERLDASLKKEKKRGQLAELRRQDAVFRLEQHIEKAKMKSVIFGEDAERSSEVLFGGKVAGWAVDAFTDIDVSTLVSELEALGEDPGFQSFFSFGCFNVSITEALRSLQGPAFFEALVSSTLVEKFFDNPFFACPPLMRDALTAVRDKIAKTDLPAACKWTADTVAQIATSDKIGVENYRRGVAETLNRYMRVVISKNDYLTPGDIQGLEKLLDTIVQESAELALHWHSHEQKFGVFKTPGEVLWGEELETFCVPHGRELEEVRGPGAWKVVATVRPGFVFYTSPVDARRLREPGVWTKARLAVREVVEAD
ncbi:hypothetical protein TWF102_004095 [Orbilia oligospora]|uniref:Uncharacterized protein n=1 Tax=Orbilia oligospora TaxID=2813651 RepID=A0A7C8NX36_ORBOL|nr:hypothetical protein TWF102_004095 [Orbilia oligospora]KAF3117622.1 hypothetical protein TWF103_004307 [Orbilia oligospora]KAF3142858.1 hypothetical protein TWF703_000362 [Orbilia oligospora]